MAEFKIGRLRFSWAGPWSTGKTFKRDDVTSHDGKSYVCLEPHTSGEFNSDLNHITGGGALTPYWTLMAEGKEWVGPWTISTPYNLGNIVTYGGATYYCSTAHTSGSSVIDLTKWTLITLFDKWNNAWANNTVYGVGDTVRYNGIVYRCNTNHVSTATTVSTDTVYNKTTDFGTAIHNSTVLSVFYAEGDTVPLGLATFYSSIANGTTFKAYGAVTNSSNVTSQELVSFVAVGAVTIISNLESPPGTPYGTENQPPFGTTYQIPVAQVASSYGSTFDTITLTATQNYLGLEKDISNWAIVSSGIEYRDDWQADTRYKLNDVVKIGPDLYISNVGHQSTTTFDPSKWDLWVPGNEFTASWSNATVYQPGDVVMYGGYSYISNTINNINHTPSTSSANWSILTQGFNSKGNWSNVTAYRTGDVVRLGGITYEAVADSTNQNPSGYAVSTTYTASGSTGKTVKVASTTGVTKGMIINAVGLTQGQTVVSVIDSNTVLISDTPDAPLVDAQDIAFIGVNYQYWKILVSSVSWRNRWQVGTQYNRGDVVVWKNGTYICITTHNSDTMHRPDTSLAVGFWTKHVLHARNNALASLGDIEFFGTDATESLEIGTDSFTLQIDNKSLAWAHINSVPSVYYVATTGIDSQAEGRGLTWDKPWKTIKYACDFVGKGRYFSNAASILLANKDWITAEMLQFMLYNVSNNIAPFNSSSVFDQTKTIRDANFVIDSVLYDIARGGNSQTVASTLSYFSIEGGNSYVNATVASEMPYIISALTYLKVLVSASLNKLPPSTSYQTLNSVGSPVTQDTSGASAEVGAGVLAGQLLDILIDALTAKSTDAVPVPNTGLTATIMVKTGTYSEILPIVVPENVAINGDELRGVVVQPAVVINTTVTAASSLTNLFTVKTTQGMVDGTPVQFLLRTVNGVSSTIGGVTHGQTYYVIGSTITATQFSVSETVNGSVVTLTDGSGSALVYGGDALQDMFRLRNATGLRNMTLTGLLGTLSDINEFLTARPTGGSFASLDPGEGPEDTTSWIIRRSPYVQNVTTFGYGCVGLKIDGLLHNGGNKSIVCNDFTQIVSDGIGVWTTGPNSLCEAVSVFCYYNYAGYFAENGGRIRATNGNSSYGIFGVVAEGYDNTETPITGTVYNRSKQVQATVQSAFGTSAEVLRLNFANAGSEYYKQTTNLLHYSNNFLSAWTTDSNLLVNKNTTAPTGLVEAWSFTRKTSNANEGYLTQSLTINPAGATYTAVSAVNISGTGSGATFDVTVNSTGYFVTVNFGGTGYVATNQVFISGGQLGGVNNVNDCIITVTGLAGSVINAVTATGTVPTGSALSYTLSTYIKQGTATSIDLYGVFSGNSSVTSAINYNFSTNLITPSRANNGFLPTQYGITPVTNGWYRIWFALNDVTGLNSNLEFRIYPTGVTGITDTYNYLYGTQAQLSDSDYAPSFYLESTTGRYTAYANYNISGAGTGAMALGDELRSGSIFQTRITDPGSGAGGAGYLTASNNSQGGTETYIILAQSDTNASANYIGMRVFVNSGTGAGQYGYISAYNATFKTAQVLRESFDTLGVTNTASSGNLITLGSSYDTSTLYIDQAIQFIPTYYTVGINSVSLSQASVTETIGGSTNTIKIPSTAQLTVNMPVQFTGSTFGGLISNYTYYITDILDDTTIQVSAQLFGTALLLNSATPTVGPNYMKITFPANNSYLSANTTDMSVNLPIQFTGTSIGGLSIGEVYYINDIIDSNRFTIAGSLVTVTPTASSSSTKGYTVSSTSGLTNLNPIVFSGTVFGGVTEGTKYYISKIIDSQTFSISSSVLRVDATHTEVTSNLITVTDTTNFVINNPIVFVGTTFGNIIAETVYYVLVKNSSTTFTISQTPGGSAVNLTTADGIMTAKTAPASLSLSTVASGSMTGTTTSTKANLTAGSGSLNGTFSTTLFGGIVTGTTYYVNTIDALNKQITVTETQGSGTPITLQTKSGAMNIGAVGWDHVNAGTPISTVLDSSSVYYIEPRVSYTAPGFVQTAETAITLAPGTQWKAIAYGNGKWMALPSGNATAASTVDGETWTSITLPASLSWTGIAYGNNYWVAISSGGVGNSKAIYSVSDGMGWRTVNLPSATTWSHVAYGLGVFVAIATGTASAAYSVNYGKTWVSATIPGGSKNWTGLAFGSGKFVAISSSSGAAAYSTDGISWTASTMPNTTWDAITYGNGRFVAVSSTSSQASAYSVDGITWYRSNLPVTASTIEYGQGVFVAVSASGTAAYTSESGLHWTARTVTNDGYTTMKFGYDLSVDNKLGKFITLAGTETASVIKAGVRAKARPVVTSGVITAISSWETGSGYTAIPAVTFTDPNITTLATVLPRIGNGTLGSPTFVNRGTGYNTSSTIVVITGDGYADAYQTGLTLIVNNLSRLPLPGDNLVIEGNSEIYKVTTATAMYGTTAPHIEANVELAPEMSVSRSPDDGAVVTIRQKYSQVRLTNHDFLNIGYGNMVDANYPNLPEVTQLAQQNQTVESNYGRVFYTSTDQDGNFKVGSLFGVEQATGIVTLSASQFGLTGLTTLSLGGIAIGGSSVVVTQFSTDSTFIANSDSIIPTQRAIKSYLEGRLSQGGANTFTGQLIAGTVLAGGPNKLGSSIPNGNIGSGIKVPVKANVSGQFAGWGGDGAAYAFFIHGSTHR